MGTTHSPYGLSTQSQDRQPSRAASEAPLPAWVERLAEDYFLQTHLIQFSSILVSLTCITFNPHIHSRPSNLMVGWWDEMIQQYHQLDGHGFEQALGVSDGQGSLVCCSPWAFKESDTTEQLNQTEPNKLPVFLLWHFTNVIVVFALQLTQQSAICFTLVPQF